VIAKNTTHLEQLSGSKYLILELRQLAIYVLGGQLDETMAWCDFIGGSCP